MKEKTTIVISNNFEFIVALVNKYKNTAFQM